MSNITLTDKELRLLQCRVRWMEEDLERRVLEAIGGRDRYFDEGTAITVLAENGAVLARFYRASPFTPRPHDPAAAALLRRA